MFEIKPTPEEIAHFISHFCSFSAFLMKNVMFCIGELHFLLAAGDMLEQNVFGVPLQILADIEIFNIDIIAK